MVNYWMAIYPRNFPRDCAPLMKALRGLGANPRSMTRQIVIACPCESRQATFSLMFRLLPMLPERTRNEIRIVTGQSDQYRRHDMTPITAMLCEETILDYEETEGL